MADGYECVLPFDRDDHQFVLGVEVGRIYHAAATGPEAFEMVVHAENAEMMLRIGEATERHVESEELDEVWMKVKFGAPG